MSNLSAANLANLSPQEKRELLAKLLQEKVNLAQFQYPLSYGQQALWFLYQLAPESTAYNLIYAAWLQPDLDTSILQQAFDLLIERHPILRSTYGIINQGKPIQQIHQGQSVHLQITEASSWSQEEINHWLIEEGDRPFALEIGPVLRVNLLTKIAHKNNLGQKNSLLVLSAHHIVLDFWAMEILIEELSSLYQGIKVGIDNKLPPLTWQYKDYVNWEAKHLASSAGEKLWSYWQKQLAGDLPVLNLPTDYPRQPVQTYLGQSLSFELEEKLTLRLKELAKTAGMTPDLVILAAFQCLIHRYTGQEDILIGSPLLGRNLAELEKIVGYFANTVVLRGDLSNNPTFRELLLRVRSVVMEALEHQDFPFSLLVEKLQIARDPSRSPLFQVAFVWEKYHPQGSLQGSTKEGERLITETLIAEQRGSEFDLKLTISDRGKVFRGQWQYNIDLFEAATIARMSGHFENLLAGIVANPEQKISELSILSAEEKHQLLYEWNNTQVDYPQDKCIHQLFEEQVKKTPDTVAVEFAEQQLTYQELNQKANQLAHYLQKLGVKAETLVGISIERSLEMVIGILAIIKAGGAYVPLDPTYPQERLAYMIEDSQVSILLTQEKIVPQLPGNQAKIICLDSNWENISTEKQNNPVNEVKPENLAYVIYTSGSTGKPKGAMNTHRGLVNRLLWMQDVYKLTENDRVLQKTPFSFDVSVWEFFWTLISGARLVVAEPGGHQDSGYLVNLISQEKITIAHFVPSMLQVFLEEKGLEKCSSLRQVICSGEALPFDLQERFFERLKSSELDNLYGPTEAAIDVSFHHCQPKSDRPIVPIGGPIANTQLYILDAQLQPVPVGVKGELHIGGVQLGRGYLNRPELTEQKFIVNPFSDDPHSRLYKTGDLARYLPNGEIEYLGRIDHQVKMRGFRIELGEIEAILSQYYPVREAVVIVREDEPGNKRLVAYLVPQAESINFQELKQFSCQKLPDYMIPSAFVELEVMPLSPNGKVDRRALPIPEVTRETEVSFVTPTTPTEKTIAIIWAEVLGIEKIGIHDNFFELGGHSLLATQVVSRLRQAFSLDFPLSSLFEKPTVAGIAEDIDQILLQAQLQPEIPISEEREEVEL